MPGGNKVWCAAGLLAASPGSCEDPAACGRLHGAPTSPHRTPTISRQTSGPLHPVSGLQHRKCVISSFLSLLRSSSSCSEGEHRLVFPSPSQFSADHGPGAGEKCGCSSAPGDSCPRSSLRSSHLTEIPKFHKAPSCPSSSSPHHGLVRWVSSWEGAAQKGRACPGSHAGLCQAWTQSQPSGPSSRALTTLALSRTWPERFMCQDIRASEGPGL